MTLKDGIGINGLINSIKENTEKMLGKQEDTIGEISALREDLKSYMENKFANLLKALIYQPYSFSILSIPSKIYSIEAANENLT